jgi:hypothetical protein
MVILPGDCLNGAKNQLSIFQWALTRLVGKELLRVKASFRQALLVVIAAHRIENSVILSESLFPVIRSHERRGCFDFGG